MEKEIKITKKSLVVEFINSQTETDKSKVYDDYTVKFVDKVSKATFYSIWNEVKGATPKAESKKIDREEIVNVIRGLYKEQELLFRPYYENRIKALMTEDPTEKKKLLDDADKALDAAQRKNFEVRAYLEANPLT